jgi:hypothetical protein
MKRSTSELSGKSPRNRLVKAAPAIEQAEIADMIAGA